MDVGAQVLPVLVGTPAGGLLGPASSCSAGIACAYARALLVSQQHFPLSLGDRLHFAPVRLGPVSILLFFLPECGHG